MENKAPIETPTTVLFRDLRRDRSLAPGGDNFEGLVRAFLPLVYGSASLLMPESTASVESVVLAVFRSFASRWRKVSKRTVVAGWLIRSTWFAAARERKRLRLPPPEGASAAAVHWALFRGLNGLRAPFLDAVVLRCVLRETLPAASRALRRKEIRVVKLVARGLAKLAKMARKRRLAAEPSALLAGIVSSAPLELESRVLSQMREWSPRQKKDELVRATLRAWEWFELRHGLRRCAKVAGTGLGIVVITVMTVLWMARQGYLTGWILRLASRQLAKDIPELTQPARPWPSGTEAAALGAARLPETASELYSLTNIWSSKLSFAPAAWKSLQPAHIPPAPMFTQGSETLILRNPKARRNGLAGVIGLEFSWVEARMEFAGVTFSNVAVRYRGNGTYVNSLFGPKQSFKVDLVKYDKGRKLAGIHTLNFVNAIPDNSYLHDALAEQLFRDLDVPAPRTAFAYLTVDVASPSTNQPLGLYVLIENIDARFAADRLGAKDVPLFKPVTPELFKDLGGDWKAYAGIYDLKTKATPEQLDRVIQFARLVTRADDAEFARRLPEFLDLEEFAGFLAGHVLLASYDGFLANGQNYFIYLDPRSDKFGFIPWDQDHAWGEFGYVGTADLRERASIWQPSTYHNRFLERVLKVEAFRDIYRRRLDHGLKEHFTVAGLYAQIDRLAAILRPAVAAESDFRLHRFDVAVSTNWLNGSRDGAPEGPKAPIHQLKRFITNRVKSVRDQLDGKAEGAILQR